MRKLSHKEQVAAIANVNPDVEVLGEITGSHTRVLCRCKICDNEWMVTPSNLKCGTGCPKCVSLKVAKNRTISHEENLSAICKVNHDIEVLEKIINTNAKILCRCKTCGNEWLARVAGIKRGSGCPKCSRISGTKKRTLPHNKQMSDIAKINKNIEILGEIEGSNKKVLCRCKVCEHEWMATPSNLKQGKGCNKCGGHMKLTHSEHVEAIHKVNNKIQIIGKIINDSTKVLCRCNVCHNEWQATPNKLKQGRGVSKMQSIKNS